MPRNKKGFSSEQRRQISRIAKKTTQRMSETKYNSGIFSSLAIQDAGRTPVSEAVTEIQQGDSAVQRIGNRVKVTGFYGKFTITYADTTNIVRVIMYMPRNPTSTLSTIDTNDLIDFDDFNILYDKSFAVSSGGPGTKNITISRKWNRGNKSGINVFYASGSSTDYAKNPIFLYVVSDSAGVPDPTINGNYRLYFKDL